MTLAVLALALKILVPQGFMVAERAGGFPLVICTGHGPLSVAGGDHDGSHDGSKAPVQKKSDAPCAFAGNITSPPPPSVAALPIAFALTADRQAGDRVVDLMPGRGLAAPPPQSHAPPSVPI